MLMVKVLCREPVLATAIVSGSTTVEKFTGSTPVKVMTGLHQPPVTPELLVGTVPSDETQVRV